MHRLLLAGAIVLSACSPSGGWSGPDEEVQVGGGNLKANSPKEQQKPVRINPSHPEIFYYSIEDLLRLQNSVSSAKTANKLDAILSTFELKYPEIEDFESVYNVLARHQEAKCEYDAYRSGRSFATCHMHSLSHLNYINIQQYTIVKEAINKCSDMGCSQASLNNLQYYWGFPRFKKIRGVINLNFQNLLQTGEIKCGLEQDICHDDQNGVLLRMGVYLTFHLVLTYFEDIGIDAFFSEKVDAKTCDLIPVRDEYMASQRIKGLLSKQKTGHFGDTGSQKLLEVCGQTNGQPAQ